MLGRVCVCAGCRSVSLVGHPGWWDVVRVGGVWFRRACVDPHDGGIHVTRCRAARAPLKLATARANDGKNAQARL